MIAYIKKLHKPIYIKQQPYGTIFYMFSFARSFIFRQKFSPPPSLPALEVGNIVSPLSTIRHDLIEMENFSQMIKLLAFYVHL